MNKSVGPHLNHHHHHHRRRRLRHSAPPLPPPTTSFITTTTSAKTTTTITATIHSSISKHAPIIHLSFTITVSILVVIVVGGMAVTVPSSAPNSSRSTTKLVVLPSMPVAIAINKTGNATKTSEQTVADPTTQLNCHQKWVLCISAVKG